MDSGASLGGGLELGDYSGAVSKYLLLSAIRARADAGDVGMIALLADIEADDKKRRARKYAKKRGTGFSDHEGSELDDIPLLDQLYIAATGLVPEPTSPQAALEAVEEAHEATEEDSEATDETPPAEHLTVLESESPPVSLLQEEVDRIQVEIETIIISEFPEEIYRHVTAQDIAEAIKTNTDADGNVHIEGVIEKVVSKLGGKGKAALKSRAIASDMARDEAGKAEQTATAPKPQQDPPRPRHGV